MGVRRIKSPGMDVPTLYTALATQFKLETSGGETLQNYYGNGQGWKPNRTLTPLVVTPVLTAVDPDSQEQFTPVFQNVTWTELLTKETYGQNEVPSRTIGDTAGSLLADYTVAADGTLTVRRNVRYDESVSLRCDIIYTDPRTGRNYTETQTLPLACSLESDEVYGVSIAQPTRRWNPLSGSSSRFTFVASATLGSTDATSSVKFFWYYVINNQEVLVDDTSNPCAAYVSGQGTSTLVVDADYESDALTFVVRIAPSLSAAAPTEPCRDHCSVIWDLPEIKEIYSTPKGRVARTSMDEMAFSVRYHAENEDISDAVSRERIIKRWFLRRRNGTTGNTDETTVIYNETATVKASSLLTSDGSHAFVGAEGFILGPLKVVKHNGLPVLYNNQPVFGRKMD